MVVAKSSLTFTWWPPGVLFHPPNGHRVVICVFSVCVPIESPVKNFLPYFEYQLNFCKFCVGLTSFMTRTKASTHFWISLCFNLSSLWQVHDVFLSNAKMWIWIFWPWFGTIKKLLILSVNGVLCYFPKCALLWGHR